MKDLEVQFISLEVGEYPGSIKLLRELHGLWPDGSKMTQQEIEERRSDYEDYSNEMILYDARFDKRIVIFYCSQPIEIK